jgi:hypothetical protein
MTNATIATRGSGLSQGTRAEALIARTSKALSSAIGFGLYNAAPAECRSECVFERP